MSDCKPYRVAEWFNGCGWCDEYDMLEGPDGFECMLTEPEDRRWFRDGKVVVEQLNRQHAEIERLRAAIHAWEDSAQQGHPSPCNLGPLCPYCEIDRLRQFTDRFPKTQDGHPVAGGDTVYCKLGGVIEAVTLPHPPRHGVYTGCFHTYEAAVAATAAGGEGHEDR